MKNTAYFCHSLVPQIALSPNGSGGLFHALSVSGLLDRLLREEIEYVHIFSCDNVGLLVSAEMRINGSRAIRYLWDSAWSEAAKCV